MYNNGIVLYLFLQEEKEGIKREMTVQKTKGGISRLIKQYSPILPN